MTKNEQIIQKLTEIDNKLTILIEDNKKVNILLRIVTYIRKLLKI